MDSLISDLDKLKLKDNKKKKEKLDLMKIINKDDFELLNNRRILLMKRIDWGKTISIPNQYIQKNILEYKLKYSDYKVYSTDDVDIPKIDISNNSPGFDLIIIKPNKSIIKIQSKLRQVNGLTDVSKQVHFETTRRNSEKNKNKNHTGHICYSVDEFDYLMISLVNDKKNRDNIKDCNKWSFVIIPISDLIDTEHNCCISHITPNILKKNLVNLDKDIKYIFD